ncbi:TonB-dependent receptor [Novosphingobium marinum]|uniref:Iron complex outermembrane receptor protein n=1 Tax=Novosphingobium marinum TaxID=1514948 RepID=A0A7Z0BUT2_9SPHN|nr:TonB-dependent receptor [Novosphingobium marinum]NYH94507.1 iron complex outermembrane receptor protein [Novosphingobium marinum]GGC22871.1 TonB-dependent receptor [Novosphingobium marinum]
MKATSLYRSTCMIALVAAGMSAPAYAQDSIDQAGPETVPAGPVDDGPAPEPTMRGGLNEIVVTATRRATDLQTTPVAVSAVDTQLIQQSAPRDVGDLAAFVPNFSAATIANFNAASFAMRGVGQTSIIIYYEPPVAVLVDDFVMPSVQTQLLDTFDIEQVEVLRGPQGTLFGKNTTGGAVTIRTKRPEMNYVGAEAQVEVGSFGTFNMKGSANLPIGDIAALRLVAGYESSDGYYKNGACYGPVQGFVPSKFDGVEGCLDGETLGGTSVISARAKLLVQPSDRFEALIQYEFFRDDSDVVPSVNVNDEYTGTVPFLSDLLGTIRPNPNSNDPLDNAAYTGRNAGGLFLQKGQRIYVDGIYANLEFDADFGTFTSVSGYRFQRSRIPNSYAGATAVAPDGTYLSFFDASRDDDRKTWQQELRFASDFAGPFNFVAGGFYQKDKTSFCVPQLLGFLDLTNGPLPFGNWNDTIYTLCNAQNATSKAVFVEGTFEVTDRLSITAGGRYTWEDKTWFGRQQVFYEALNGGFDPSLPGQINTPLDANVFDYPAGVISVDGSWSEPTYRASISYEATDDLYIYGTYSHGFKGGGFNDQAGNFGAFGDDLDAFRVAAQPTNPETADSFEAGFKSEFLDNRARLNVTAFYVKYKDLQKQLNVPIIVNGQPNQLTTFVNAASAEVKGLEVEASANPFEGFTLRGVLGYQDGKYNRYESTGAGYDLATAPLDRAPKWQWTVNGTYEVPVTSEFDLTLNGSVAYVGRNLNTQAITDPDGNTYLNARTLVNASITLNQVDDKYYVRLIGQNLTDERYKVAIQNVAGLWQNAQYGPPRYFGVEVGFKFGENM